MRLILVCPVCSEALTVERLPGPVACPKCFQPFPAAAREAVARELEWPPPPDEVPVRRPFLLTAWMGVSALDAVKLVLILVAAAVLPGAHVVNGMELSGAEFFLRFLVPLVGTTVLMAAGAYGIWMERPWTRRVLLASWLWIAASFALVAFAKSPGLPVTYPVSFVLIAQGKGVLMVLLPLLGFAVTAWYLYAKPNVVAYYRAIEAGGTAS